MWRSQLGATEVETTKASGGPGQEAEPEAWQALERRGHQLPGRVVGPAASRSMGNIGTGGEKWVWTAAGREGGGEVVVLVLSKLA